MGRGKVKTHGDPRDAKYVGAPSGKMILIEDVTTTGGSSLKTVDDMLETLDDIEIMTVLAIVNRGSTGYDKKFDVDRKLPESLEARDIGYSALVTHLDLLKRWHERFPLNQTARDEITTELAVDDYEIDWGE